MAVPKSLTEWLQRLALLSGRIQSIRAAVNSVIRVESSAGMPGVQDWPIDGEANDIMANALAKLNLEMDGILGASFFYKYTIEEGRPDSLWSVCVYSNVIHATAPRQYIVGNPDIEDWSAGDDNLPFRFCNPTLYGQAYTDKISLKYDATEGMCLFDNDGAGFTVQAFAPSCPPSQPAGLGVNGRGIEVEALECLHLLDEVYQAGISIDPDKYWSFNENWMHQVSSHVRCIGPAIAPNPECLIQIGENMKHRTVEGVVYEVAINIISPVSHAGAALQAINPQLDGANDYPLAIRDNGAAAPGWPATLIASSTTHLFYILCADNDADLIIEPVIAPPEFEIVWTRMTPMIGQLLPNGMFYTSLPIHSLGIANTFIGTDRWMGTLTAGGQWTVATGDYYAQILNGHEILYQRGPGLATPTMPIALEDAPAKYVVEFSMMWLGDPYALGNIYGIQPAIGDITLAGPNMVAGSGYGDPVFPPNDGNWYRYRQIIESGISGSNNCLAFVPRFQGVPGGVVALSCKIKDVLLYPYEEVNDSGVMVPEQAYDTETTLVDRA